MKEFSATIKFLDINKANPKCELCERQIKLGKKYGAKRVIVRTDILSGEIIGVEL